MTHFYRPKHLTGDIRQFQIGYLAGLIPRLAYANTKSFLDTKTNISYITNYVYNIPIGKSNSSNLNDCLIGSSFGTEYLLGSNLTLTFEISFSNTKPDYTKLGEAINITPVSKSIEIDLVSSFITDSFEAYLWWGLDQDSSFNNSITYYSHEITQS